MENAFLSMYNMLDKVTVCGHQSHKRMTSVMDMLLEMAKAHEEGRKDEEIADHSEKQNV